ncbi:MAG: hypothetical protein RLZZ272_72 [Actinomycetota bacterium]
MLHARTSLAVLVLVLVAACGGSPSSLAWRNIVLPVPDGWVVVEESDERVRLASASAEDGVPVDGLVVLSLTFEPRTLPDDVRAAAIARGATIESDGPIVVGDEVPATRIVVLEPTAGAPTREMIVLVPSRGLVAVGGVVAGASVADPAARLLDDLDVLLSVLEDASYGPPVLG